MKRAAICVLLLLFLGNIFAQVSVSLDVVSAPTNEKLRGKFKAYTLVRVDHENLYEEHLQNEGPINFEMDGLDGRSLDFTITPWELRSESYFRQLWDGERTHRQFASQTPTYRGSLAEEAGSEAYFTIDRQFILGRWDINRETYFLEPLKHLDATADYDIYVVYRADDAIMPPDFCGVNTSLNSNTELELIEDGKDAGPEKAGDCYVVDIALASDFELYQSFGNDETSVENFMLNGLMNVQTNYDDEFADEIQFQVVTTYIATCNNSSCDPWTNNTDAETLLDDFVDWGNDGNFGVSYDVASLWTGRNFGGSTIGIAYVGAICTGLRYNTCQGTGLSEQALRVLWAHELGHNFNSNHDTSNGFIMSPSVSTTTVWSDQSQNVINNYIPTRGCLSNCSSSSEPPVAFIEAAYEEVCEGSYIAFFDESEGNVTGRFWSFDGGTPSSSTDPHPIVFFPNEGSYSVSLSVENNQGSDFTNFIVDVEQDDAFSKVLYYENFEEGFGGWDDENPDNNIGWEITQVGGNFGGNAAYVNNYDYDAAGQTDALISPFFDLSGQSDIHFSFEYAYARYDNSLNDDLRVSLSTDGGSTFPNILFESDNNFATTADNENFFIPNSASDWCNDGPGCIDLDLSDYTGESDVVIKIENITGYGNNMFVDNIALTASCAPASPPVADYSQNKTIGCAPLTVSFIDLSSGTISYREWEFPGGDPDFTTEPNPIIVYNTAGVYDVSLYVENSAGSDLFTEIGAVTVLEQAVADFSFSNIDVNTYSFTSLSSGDISLYEWDFGDGDISNEINPTHAFDSPGTYEVALRVYNDCGSDLFFEIITIEASLTADFQTGTNIGCAPLLVAFTDLSEGNPDSWEWDFPGGDPSFSTDPNPVVTYTSAGDYDVSLTVMKGDATESLSFSNYISVTTGPMAAFIVTTTAGNLTVSLEDQSSGSNTTGWNFGDGNTATGSQMNYTYDSPGTYTITQTVENECGTDVATQTVTLALSVDPAFTASVTNGCTPQSISFTASPQEAGNSYSWTFQGGDPATSDAANPTVSYESAGSFDVSLTITNAAGPASITQTDYITIGTGPAAAFTATNTPGSLTVDLQDQSSGANTIAWNFGDGNTAAGSQTSYTYDSPGTYTITQTVSNECGTDMATQTVTLILPVDPSFTASATNGCTPQSISFTASPQEAGNSYNWTFEGGDPATSNEANPTVSYENAGSFDVSLTITNAAGPASITQTDYITIGTGPTAAFTATNTPGSLMVDLDDQSSGANTLGWDFGDGNTAAGSQTSYTYDSPGTYTITQTVSNECGTDMATQTVTLILPVDPSFTASATNGCTPQSISFTASPQEAGNSYNWTFEGGDPATSNEANPMVSYENAGSFDVSLTITNAAGPASITQTDYITIGTGPAAAFTATSTPGSLTVDLQDQSSGANTLGWDFGDGNTAAGSQTSYTYDSPGTYTITQTVSNECGTDMATQTVTLILPVDPSFTASATNGCTPQSISFTASPQEAGNSYNWTFEGGDPATSNEANPTVSYESAGSFDVSLTITNAAGPASITQTDYITIGTGPTAAFTATNTPGSLMVDLDDQSSGGNTLSWNFGDGNTTVGTQTNHTYDAPGTYTITQTVTNECGVDMATQTVTLVLPIEPSFTTSSVFGCPPYNPTFFAMPQEAGNTYEWIFEGGSPMTSTDPQPNVKYHGAGMFNVSLTITNAAGSFTVTEEEYMNVGGNPTADFIVTTTPGDLTITLEDQSIDGNYFSWHFGDGTTLMGEQTSYTYDEPGTYTITQVVDNTCGNDVHSETIIIQGSVPEVSFTATNNEGCGPLSVSFNSEIENADSFSWTFQGGEPAMSTQPNPVITYNTPGTYPVTLTATNVFGGNATTQNALVTVLAPVTADFDYVLDATTASFSHAVTGISDILWTFPDGSTSAIDAPTYTFPGNGSYVVSLQAIGSCNTETVDQTIDIDGPLPVVEVMSSVSKGCAPLSVIFSDNSTQSPTAWVWNFPGGTPATSNEASVDVTYPVTGIYSVDLSVTNIYGTTTQEWIDYVEVVDVPTVPEFSEETFDGISYAFDVIASMPEWTYNWDFGDGTMAEGTSAVHTYSETGMYTVTLTVTNDCGSATASLEVNVVITHTDTPEWVSKLWLSPNPTQGNLLLHAEDWLDRGELTVYLTNTLGQSLQQQSLMANSGNWQHRFDLSGLPAGTYWLQLQWGTSQWTQKVIKL